MLRGLVISPDQNLAEELSRVLSQLGGVTIVRNLEYYPQAEELGRVVRACAPDVAFISSASMNDVAEQVKQLDRLAPGIQFVALSRDCDPQVLLDAMRVGIREFVSAPINTQSVYEAVSRVKDLIDRNPPRIQTTSDIYSFMPAKAGVGASTLALNVAVAMSRTPDSNVMLSDFDMNSGMMRFMLKLNTEFSVADACEHAMHMDEALWPQLITKMGNLDVLHAGKLNPNLRIEGQQIHHLIDFLRRNYSGLVFDLSGNLERYSFDIMQECKKIFLVCTPEIPALHLAREKFVFLRSLELDHKVSVLVNRCQKRQVITNEQIEQILGLPVHMVFPNDYSTVHKALTAGRWVETSTELGKAVNQFAKGLIEPKAGTGGQPASSVKKGFLGFLTGAKAS
jgi:pilus assembly protein CpaE